MLALNRNHLFLIFQQVFGEDEIIKLFNVDTFEYEDAII